MRLFRPFAALPLLAFPPGCFLAAPGPYAIYSPCAAIATSNWSAWVESHGGRRGRLVVEGEVTVPAEGYAASLARGPVQRLDGPVQQILVRTEGTGGGPPAVRHVRGEFRALNAYSAVQLRCGDGTVAMLRDIPRRAQ
jgi:hypothetical protein